MCIRDRLFLHAGQQILLAALVQLAEHIVQQEHRVLSGDPGSGGRFGHFQAQHHAALLSLTCKHLCGLVVQQQLNILAVDAAQALPGAQLPVHKDYLGSLMGLELRREALGDIVLPEDQPGVAYVFALEPAAELICQELRQAGHTDLTAEMQPLETLPAFPQAERPRQTATVSSLRLDAVLAAMLRCSRGMAAELVTAGRVEINHLPAEKPHAPVYEGDVFTVRGKGRFGLTALPGKSKKDRSIIEFFQY